MRNYADIIEVFNRLNSRGIRYLVLRNFESLSNTDLFLMEGHLDIDILCQDSQEIVRILDLETDRKDIPPFKGDGIHYTIRIKNVPVSLDLRYVGDGYYCRAWEKDMLERKIRQDFFYVMNEEDYFYSLIYHSILQKRFFSEDYRQRLIEMAIDLEVNVGNAQIDDFLSVLQIYMKKNDYQYEYVKDFTVPCRFNLVDQKMIKRDRHLRFIHWKFDAKVSLIDKLVKIKHAIIG